MTELEYTSISDLENISWAQEAIYEISSLPKKDKRLINKILGSLAKQLSKQLLIED